MQTKSLHFSNTELSYSTSSTPFVAKAKLYATGTFEVRFQITWKYCYDVVIVNSCEK